MELLLIITNFLMVGHSFGVLWCLGGFGPKIGGGGGGAFPGSATGIIDSDSRGFPIDE